MRWASLALVSLVALAAACARDGDWARAEALWRQKDPSAYAAWRRLDPATAEGAAAERRLTAAQAHFARGIALLAAGQPGARDELLAGDRLGPMDPASYLPLARACRVRGLPQRAAEFYRKFLAGAPGHREAAAARAELAALDPELDGIFEPPPPSRGRAPLTIALALAALALLGLAAAAGRRRRRRRRTLAELAADNPELQPAIAYLVGCLRHELFKHRILAGADAVAALVRGEAQPGQRAFLFARLFGGEPLTVAWAGHLGAFMRALGPRFDLVRHDDGFRQAGRAVAELASLESAFAAGAADAARRLGRVFERLAGFDRALAALVTGLTHTAIDGALLAEVAAAARADFGPDGAAVALTIDEPPPGVAVEMYRVDLMLVLTNVVRNAVAAALRGPAPPRVALDVLVELEPSGDEVVRIRVRDTNAAPLPTPAPTRGLGLVTTALERCDGALLTGAAEPPFAKAVVVRLFRALDAAPAEAVA